MGKWSKKQKHTTKPFVTKTKRSRVREQVCAKLCQVSNPFCYVPTPQHLQQLGLNEDSLTPWRVHSDQENMVVISKCTDFPVQWSLPSNKNKNAMPCLRSCFGEPCKRSVLYAWLYTLSSNTRCDALNTLRLVVRTVITQRDAFNTLRLAVHTVIEHST